MIKLEKRFPASPLRGLQEPLTPAALPCFVGWGSCWKSGIFLQSASSHLVRLQTAGGGIIQMSSSAPGTSPHSLCLVCPKWLLMHPVSSSSPPAAPSCSFAAASHLPGQHSLLLFLSLSIL